MKNQARISNQIAWAMASLVLHSVCANADTIYVWGGDNTIMQFGTNGVGSVLASNINQLSGWNGRGLGCR
jgi:hypothetical protein